MTINVRTSLLPRALSVIALTAAACGIQAQTSTTPGTTTSPATAADRLDAIFKRVDANQDGKLSKEEAARLPSIAERFDQLDKDKDGMLSLDELKAAAEPAK